jgi:hypothetical protein
VKVDLKDKNNYMPVAMHPTEVVKKAREFQTEMQPYGIVDDSMQSSARDSNFFDPSPSFRQPDFPYQSDNPTHKSRHEEALKNQSGLDLTGSMIELQDRSNAL